LIALRPENSHSSIQFKEVTDIQKFTDFNNYDTFLTDRNYASLNIQQDEIIYSNHNVLGMTRDYNDNWVFNSSIFFEKTMPFDYQIKESMYDIFDHTSIFDKDTTITITTELEAELTKVNPDAVKSTEKIIEAVKTADIAAEKNYSDVIATDITSPIIVDWLDGLLNGLKDLLEWLFVPSSVALTDFVTHAETTMEDKAGLLTYPLTLVIEFLLNVAQLGTTDCILKIPRIEFMGYVLYGGIDYNITQNIKQTSYSQQIYNVYIMITNFIMIIAVLNLAVKKGDEIIRGN
jgi:hypothetical protein